MGTETTSVETIRVLVVDDHPTILWGLTSLIDSAKPKMEVAGAAGDLAEAVDAALREQPDIVLLDLDLRGEDSAKIIPAILKGTPARVLVLTGLRDTEAHDRAMLSGARGVLHKEAPAEVILKAIEKVHRGELWLDRLSTGRLFEKLLGGVGKKEAGDAEAARAEALTGREREVITALVELGQGTNKHVAEHLNMSEFTLRNHLTSIYAKLGVGNRLDLLKYALRHGLAASPAAAARDD